VTLKLWGDATAAELAEVAVKAARLGPGVYDCRVEVGARP
jgi:hypothetical protein